MVSDIDTSPMVVVNGEVDRIGVCTLKPRFDLIEFAAHIGQDAVLMPSIRRYACRDIA
ncbi:hypothetical protein M2333_000251 [Sphingobium sp. B11D3B]|uniref:hypothetical protein n=1 Tax=Sphingobium sp. B11D3B TaxID=2940575 RepID=UPI0022262A06|nr:hypothetical protein [Sphingobium sp. B11D3B]MCW2387205.1 hypothetical protein [Sphingobium sp. B11D3B]